MKGDHLTPLQIARESQNAYDALTSYSDNGTAVIEGGGTTENITFNIRLQRPGFYRVDWTTTGGFYSSKGVIWNNGSGNYFVMGAANQMDAAKPQKLSSMEMALASAGGVSGTAADAIPGTFFNVNWGGQLEIFSSSRVQTRRFPDETVGGVACYVIEDTLHPVKLPHSSGTSGTVTTQLWIGKQDHLIRRIKTTTRGASVQMPIKDQNLKTILARQGKAATPEAMAALRSEMEARNVPATGDFVFTQSHENISVNRNFSTSDFAR